MSICKCPGEALVGSMGKFNGEGHGQSAKIAIQGAYRNSGLTEAYIVLVKLAFEWECAGHCRIRTQFEIKPAPVVKPNPQTGLWEANLTNATLKVWVVCSETDA